jgi:tol-pal system protein YbgF
MKKLCSAVAFLAVACASSAPEPAATPVPQQSAASDPRIGELQTAMTELLERIDVLNDRIARLEEGEATAASPAETQMPPADPSPPLRAGSAAAAPQAPPRQPPQRALIGAKIAEDYRQAIMLFGRNRHADARRGFEAVFEADPNGDLADNALFWIGETYFAAKDYTNAMRFYSRVVNDYSTQNKAPDALFKTAIAQERTGDLALARRTLQQVIERYPYSSAASTAKAELERIRF